MANLKDMFSHNEIMGENSKLPKSTNYKKFQAYLVNCPDLNQKYIKKPIIICLLRHFEADLGWEVGHKILNLGIILKTFTLVRLTQISLASFLLDIGKQCRPSSALQRLIRLSTVCLQNVLLRFE